MDTKELKNKRLYGLVKPSTFEDMEQIASDMGISVNALVNIAVINYIKNYRKDNANNDR